jgi:hypothetical protein
MAAYCSKKGVDLITSALYMPIEWHGDDYTARRKASDIPERLLNLRLKIKLSAR